MDYIHLIGSEQVQSAANSMSQSADTINRAAGSMDASLQDFKLFLSDWLIQYEEITNGRKE